MVSRRRRATPVTSAVAKDNSQGHSSQRRATIAGKVLQRLQQQVRHSGQVLSASMRQRQHDVQRVRDCNAVESCLQLKLSGDGCF